MGTLVISRRPLAVLTFLLAPALALAQPTSRTHDTGVVQFEVFDNGKLGAYADGTVAVGTGFVFNGENGLFEGQVLVGRSSTQVSGDAYEYPDVEWVNVAPFQTISPPSGFDEAYAVAFEDDPAPSPIGVRVTERSYSNTGDPYVVVDLDVTNTTASPLTGIYVGVFADWDVDPVVFAQNLCGFDATTELLYCWDPTGANPNYYGQAALAGANVSGTNYDALPGDAILFTALTTIQTPPATGGDRRTVLGTGPYSIGAGQTVNVKFAFVGGTSLSDIVANAAAAQASVGGCDLKFLASDLTYDAGTRRLCADVTVRNNGTSANTARLELDYNRNGGNPQGTRVLGSGTLPGGVQATRSVCLTVPGAAPDGNYNFDLRLVDAGTGGDCGSYQETIAISAPRLGEGAAAGELFGVEEAADFSVSASAASGSGVAVAPNPFARQTTIHYAVEGPSDVRLAVYDVLGREVAVLADARMEAGTHSAVFDASDLAAGTYVYRLVVGNDVQTGRMTLAR